MIDIGNNGENAEAIFAEAFKNCRLDYRVVISRGNDRYKGVSIGFSVRTLRGSKPIDRFNDYYHVRQAFEKAGYKVDEPGAQVQIRVRQQDNRKGREDNWYDTLQIWVSSEERLNSLQQNSRSFTKNPTTTSQNEEIPF